MTDGYKEKYEDLMKRCAEAVAKENAQLNEHNEKLKEQTKLYFHAFNKAAARIEKLQSALQVVIDWDNTLEFEDELPWGEVMEIVRKALEGKDD